MSKRKALTNAERQRLFRQRHKLALSLYFDFIDLAYLLGDINNVDLESTKKLRKVFL